VRALSTREESAYACQVHHPTGVSLVYLKTDDLIALAAFYEDLPLVLVFVFFFGRIKIIIPYFPEFFAVVGASQFLHSCSRGRFILRNRLTYGHRASPSFCFRGGYISGILQGNVNVGAM